MLHVSLLATAPPLAPRTLLTLAAIFRTPISPTRNCDYTRNIFAASLWGHKLIGMPHLSLVCPWPTLRVSIIMFKIALRPPRYHNASLPPEKTSLGICLALSTSTAVYKVHTNSWRVLAHNHASPLSPERTPQIAPVSKLHRKRKSFLNFGRNRRRMSAVRPPCSRETPLRPSS
jgi:hypothetical protein